MTRYINILLIMLIVLLNACIKPKPKQKVQYSNLFSEEAMRMPHNSYSNNQTTEGKIYNVVEQMAEFPGGEEALLKFIKNKLNYPNSAIQKKIQGIVIIQFTINEHGYIAKDINILRSLDPACDHEAIRVIKLLPPFIPGKQNGENVSVLYTLPIRFKLEK